jgi:AcrR family transcriptional regulator
MVNDGKLVTGRSGRPRAGTERLSREAILQAALRIVDDEGLDAMTMRRLAATLGVNPMSIYHHLPNKAAVFAGLAELVFAGIDPAPTTPTAQKAVGASGQEASGASGQKAGGAGGQKAGAASGHEAAGASRQKAGGARRGKAGAREASAELGWGEELVGAARAYREALRAHPNLALQVLADAAAVSAVVVVTVEPFYRALDRAGLEPRQIFEAVNTLIDFIHGFSLGEASVRSETFELAPDLLERVSKLQPGQAPTLTRVVEALGADGLHYEFDDGFEIGLSVFVEGIAARFGL